jgi:hypothetical protein
MADSYIALSALMSAPVVTRAISTIPVANRRITQFFNLTPGSAAIDDVGGHMHSWDIYDNTRDLAYARAVGSGPSTRPMNVVGNVQARIARFHEKTGLINEKIFRKRGIGQPPGTVDISGQNYITREQGQMAQRLANTREFMCSRVFRGGWSYIVRGDDFIPCDLGTSGAIMDVDLKIPAGNKGQLDMLGGGAIINTAWSNPAADIIADSLQINSAATELTGLAIRHWWMNSVTFGYLLANTGLKAIAGTSNRMFERWERSPYNNPDGVPDTGYEATFIGLPGIIVHVYDHGHTIENADGTRTYTKLFPDDYVAMCPDVSGAGLPWIGGANGSEPITETVVSEMREGYGIQAWTEAKTQPGRQELITLDNFIPTPFLPKAILYAKVANF